MLEYQFFVEGYVYPRYFAFRLKSHLVAGPIKKHFTYFTSPTKSSCVPLSLSNIFRMSSSAPSDMVNTKVSFHSGSDPFPVCNQETSFLRVKTLESSETWRYCDEENYKIISIF